MMALDPARSSDEICCFIGTTAAIIMAATAAASAGSSIYAANKQADTAQNATRATVDANNSAAALQAKSAADALDYAKQQEAERQREWEQTQQQNFGIYQQEKALEQQRYNERQQRLAPYQRFGAGAVSQLGQPIPGSIGAMVNGGQ